MKRLWCTGVIVGDDLCPTGYYADEKSAVDDCLFREAVFCMPMGRKMPGHVLDLEKLYFPHQEKWEHSPLYRQQQRAKKIVEEWLNK